MTETNSFSDIPTSYASFESSGIRRGEEVLRMSDGRTQPQLEPLLEFARARRLQIVPGLAADAAPGAPVQQRDYERLREEILERLARAAPVKAVLLAVHGAMMATECWDCEGDLLRRVRAIVGPRVPVAAVLDPHAHLTQAMVDNASVLVFMKQYPHVDGIDRMRDALRIVGGMLDGYPAPTPAVAECRVVGIFPTDEPPMSGLVARLAALEDRPGVVSVSLVHGFPWGDTPVTGAKVLVYTSGDRALAHQVADEVRREFWAIRHDTGLRTVSVEEAVILAKQPRSGLLVLADVADNPGGGAPSDSTFLLRALVEAGVQDVAVGLVYDPELVRLCRQVGAGGRLRARIGGKTGPASGMPLDLDVEVRGLRSAAVMRVLEVAEFPLGDTAWIHGAGIDIVLSSLRVQAYSPSAFTHIGLDPSRLATVVVKSTAHFRASFSRIAESTALVSTPGALDLDFARIPYRVFRRPYFPRDPDPFATVDELSQS